MSRIPMMPVLTINISASPHPPGIYLKLFNVASKKIVKSRSNDAALITKPKHIKDDYYSGRVLIWTEIDLNGPWLDIDSEDEISDILRNDIKIPQQAKPNYRSFDYLLDTSKHKFYVEIKNEINQSLGPTTIRNILSRLMQPDIQGKGIPDIEVTVIPDEKAVETILNLPGLRTLTIRVVRPNADETDTDARKRVLMRLQKAGAQIAEEKWTKSSSAERLEPDAITRETAKVAAEDGFVRGEGRRKDGRKVTAATDDTPRIRFVNREQGDSFYERISNTFNLRRP